MASFEELPSAVQDVLRAYEEKNGNGERPTFRFGPSASLGISSPVQGNVYPADTSAPDTNSGGALSQAAVQVPAQQIAAQAPTGALSQSMLGLVPPKMLSPQEALNQYVPQNDQRGQYLALAAGFGSATKTGGLGEQIGNVASAMQQQKQQQEQLRMQYLPHIMQQVIAQQNMEFERQKFGTGMAMVNGQAPAPGAPVQGVPQDPNTQPAATPQAPVIGAPTVAGTAPGITGAAPMGQVSHVQPIAQPTGQPAGNGGVDPRAVGLDIAFNGGKGVAGMYAKNADLTDFAKQLIQGGMVQGSPEFNAQMAAKNLKDTRLQPTSLRPGAPYIGSDNKIHTTPASPPAGHMNVVDANDNWSVVPIPGGIDATTTAAKATAMGTAAAHPTTVYGGPSGTTPIQSTAALQAAAAQGVPPPAGSPMATSTGPVSPALAPGIESAATGTQKQMIDKFGDLTTQVAQAQTQNSYLKGIADQAKKAIIGPASDKLNYANNLLAQAGLPASTDMATAYEVMKKNESQIIARMRTGGLGTDQAQTLLQAAYPNSGMTIDAIDKTSQNLIGANDMIIAKNSVLAPHANALSPVTYSQNESVFNKNADPTLFERYSTYQHMVPGSPAAKAYLGSVTAQDPTFLNRVQNLKAIGAF
jgi:hypothetical protein